MQIKYSTTLEAGRVKKLKQWSQETKIPQAKLVEQAIDLLGAQLVCDRVTPEFRRIVDQVIKEDLPALRRLAE